MRRLATVVLLVLCLGPPGLQAAEQTCDRSGSLATPSPDGQWIANVQEEVCATASGAQAGVTVILAQAANPAHAKRVFIMPVPRSREEWPRIRWSSPTAMEVRVPNLSEATPPQPQFEGIHIALAYFQDNPGDRAQLAAYKDAVAQWQRDVSAWAARRKQDPDGAGARPARPEEPRLSPGRCLD